jgi:hypothetical protein
MWHGMSTIHLVLSILWGINFPRGSFNTNNVEVSSFVSNFNYPDYCIGFNDVGFRIVSKVK